MLFAELSTIFLKLQLPMSGSPIIFVVMARVHHMHGRRPASHTQFKLVSDTLLRHRGNSSPASFTSCLAVFVAVTVRPVYTTP